MKNRFTDMTDAVLRDEEVVYRHALAYATEQVDKLKADLTQAVALVDARRHKHTLITDELARRNEPTDNDEQDNEA